jgi:plastocyanin
MFRLPCASLVIFLAALPVAIGFADAVTTVVQKDRAFNTASVTIAAGSTIHFTNADEFVHQVYVASPDFSFESSEQEPDQSLDQKFPVVGTFIVHCHIHPKMSLQVNVR